MPNIQTLGPLNGSFIIRPPEGMYRGHEEVDVVAPAAGLQPGTILGRVTATGRYARHAPGAGDGSQTVAGILLEGVPPSTAGVTIRRTVIVRDYEVHKTELIYSAGADAAAITAADTALRGLGIIPRL